MSGLYFLFPTFVHNKDKKGTINVFGLQNREWYPEETIQKVVNALESGDHQVELIPADRFLLAKLNKFLPKLRFYLISAGKKRSILHHSMTVSKRLSPAAIIRIASPACLSSIAVQPCRTVKEQWNFSRF